MYLMGITSSATWNNNELPTTSWNVDATAVILQYINSKTGLHPVKQSTIIDATFQVTCDFDPTLDPFAAPFSFVPGLTLTSVRLDIDGLSGSYYWSFPQAIISRCSQGASRPGKIGTILHCEASGQFMMPGGSLI